MRISSLPGNVVLLTTLLTACVPLRSNGVIPPESPTSVGAVSPIPRYGKPENSHERWAHFLAHNPGIWWAKWDLSTGAPVYLYGSGCKVVDKAPRSSEEALEVARAFLDRNRAVFGSTDLADLHVIRVERVGNAWYVTMGQKIDGITVRRGGMDLRIWEDGRVYSVRSKLLDGSSTKESWITSESSAGQSALLELGASGNGTRVETVERVWLPSSDPVSAYEVRVMRENPPLDWTILVSGETGDVIFGYSNIRYIRDHGRPYDGLGIECLVELQQLPQFYDELPVNSPCRWGLIEVDELGSYYTDAGGYLAVDSGYPLDADISTRLSGIYLSVTSAAGPSAYAEAHATSRSITRINWSASGARPDEMNCYYHGNLIHDFVKDTLAYDGMDFQMPCRAGLTGYENAYWDGNGMTFGGGGTRFRNFALFSDVIYHEYTHGVTDHIYRPYGLPYIGESGAIDEAVADYFAATITDDPEIGNGGLFVGFGQNLRNMDNTLIWPDDRVGEVHADGEILGGALWDLREYAGCEAADRIIHLARYDWPQNFEEFFYAALLSDDDNGNLADGTPHDAAIFVAFGNHGFAPDPDEQVVINHSRLPDSEDTLRAYPIRAEIISGVGIDTSAVFAAYSDGGEFSFLDMEPSGRPNEYVACIPPQPLGTTISYYLSVGLNDVPIFYTDPPNAPEDLHTFRVLVDTIRPVIEHEPVSNLPYGFWPLEVSAQVTDNVGVGQVLVEYSKGSELDTAYAHALSGSDFVATLTGEIDVGDTLTYRIVAIDSSRRGNASVLPDEGWFTTAFGLGFYEDVEGDVSSWTHEGLTDDFLDAWIVSSAHNHTTAGLSSWLCLGTDPSGRSLKVDAGLVAPAFRLAAGSWLSFWHLISADTQNDFVAWNGAVVEISPDDGATWQIVEPVGGYTHELMNDLNPLHGVDGCFSGESADWEQVTFDLSQYQGDVLVRFRLALDGYGEGEMWAIDDINLFAGNPVGLLGEGHRTASESGDISPWTLRSFPNPFNPNVTIEFALPENADYSIEVYDLKGRLVRRLRDGKLDGHTGSVTWNATDESNQPVASGIYFIRLSSQGRERTDKIVLLR
jgi:hypothetical protein